MAREFLFVFIALFAAASFGQTPAAPSASAEEARAEFMNPKYWSKIGAYDNPTDGFTIYSRNLLPNPEGQIEFWAKIVPKNVEKFNKKYGLSANSAFVLQYVTADCTRKVIILERAGVYDANDIRLGSGSAQLTPKTFGGKVKPGSISSEIFESICIRLQ